MAEFGIVCYACCCHGRFKFERDMMTTAVGEDSKRFERERRARETPRETSHKRDIARELVGKLTIELCC